MASMVAWYCLTVGGNQLAVMVGDSGESGFCWRCTQPVTFRPINRIKAPAPNIITSRNEGRHRTCFIRDQNCCIMPTVPDYRLFVAAVWGYLATCRSWTAAAISRLN